MRWLVFALLFAATAGHCQEVDQDVEAMRKEYIQEMNDSIKRITEKMTTAQRERNAKLVAAAKDAIAERKRNINLAKKATPQELEQMVADRQAQKDRAEQRKLTHPLVIKKMGIVVNRIGVPELVVQVRNESGESIEAFTVSALCFNKFDEPMGLGGDNLFNGISQDLLEDGESDLCQWSLTLRNATAYANIWISRIKFADGTVWEQSKEDAQSRDKSYLKAERAD